jgi:hypothetical protein
MRSTRLAAAVIAPCVVVAAALSGCGGSSNDEVGALSKSQFAKKSNGLCASAQAERAQLLNQLPTDPSGPGDAGKLNSVVGIDRELIRKVDALVPPESEQDRVDRVLDGWRKRAGVEQQYADAVGSMQDPSTLASFTANLAQIDAANDPIAIQLGLSQCTRGSP